MLSINELYDLHNEVCARIGSEGILELLSYANRVDGLEDLLESIGLGDLLDGGGPASFAKKKVLVIGDSRVGVNELRRQVRKNDMDPSDFEFCLEYDKVKRFDFRKLRYSEKYGAVIVGPQPHSTPGKRDSSSAIAEMERHDDIYPVVIECGSESGELKITKNGFAQALQRLEERF